MTKQEAIKKMKECPVFEFDYNADIDEWLECFGVAINALEKQSHICSNCKYFNKDWTYTCTEVHLCTKHNIARYENAFCSDWEKKDD